MPEGFSSALEMRAAPSTKILPGAAPEFLQTCASDALLVPRPVRNKLLYLSTTIDVITFPALGLAKGQPPLPSAPPSPSGSRVLVLPTRVK
jgi:hypothetical protein